jgi:aryl-alcohol dehydrogenase-like predicted oxidoreductase
MIMEKRQLGQSSIEATAVTLGTWAIGGWAWGGTDKSQAIQAIQESIDQGITSIDTAPVYGFGLSESIVGEAIKGHKDKVQIFTKYGLRWDQQKGQFYFETQDNEGKNIAVYKYAAKESVIHECEQSLRRLNVDKIDLFQIHWPDETTPIEETMEAMDKLMDQGKIVAPGVSNYSVDQMKTAEKIVSLASNQVPYSMVRRDIEQDVVPYCRENNKAILAYSPLQRGLLTGKMDENYTFNEGDNRANNPYFQTKSIKKVNDFLDKIKPIAEGHHVTLPQLVIAWTKQQPGITVALVGARNPKQARENAEAANVVLTDEEMKTINGHLDQLNLDIE